MNNSYILTPGDAKSRDLVALVQSRWQASTDYVRQKYQKTQTWNDAFRGLYTGKIANYLNDITPPLIFATIMSSVSHSVNAIFGSWPIIQFQGFPDGAAGIAKKNELLVNLQLKEAESYRKAIQFFMRANIDGVAVADTGWSHIQHLRQYRTWMPGSNQMMEVKDMVSDFDGPQWEPMDLLNFRPEPGKTHITQMGWYIKRYWVDFDDLLEMNAGNPDGPISPQALHELSQTGVPTASTPGDEFMAFSRYRSFADFMATSQQTAYSKPVEIWEMRGTVPYEFAPDGIRKRVVLIANGKVILRNDPDKILLGRHRIITYSPTPDPYHFVGIGKAEIAEPLQAMAGRLMSSKLDAFDLFLKPMFVAAQGSTQSQNMSVKPGRIFQVNTRNRPISEVIQALPVNLQPLAMAYQEFGFLDSMIQKGTGVDERGVMGMGGSGDVTARQFLGQQDAAMTRVNMENMLASVDSVEPLAELFRDMNKTMLPLPKQFSMIGTRAVVNEITGMPMPPDQGMIVDPGELNHDWSAKAFGPGFMLTRSAQKADAMQLNQIMAANPVYIQTVNWIAMARKIFGLFDWNADEMLQRLPQFPQMAAQLGMSPEQAVQSPGMAPFGGAGGQQMSPVQAGAEPTQNAPLGVGP